MTIYQQRIIQSVRNTLFDCSVAKRLHRPLKNA